MVLRNLHALGAQPRNRFQNRTLGRSPPDDAHLRAVSGVEDSVSVGNQFPHQRLELAEPLRHPLVHLVEVEMQVVPLFFRDEYA